MCRLGHPFTCTQSALRYWKKLSVGGQGDQDGSWGLRDSSYYRVLGQRSKNVWSCHMRTWPYRSLVTVLLQV